MTILKEATFTLKRNWMGKRFLFWIRMKRAGRREFIHCVLKPCGAGQPCIQSCRNTGRWPTGSVSLPPTMWAGKRSPPLSQKYIWKIHRSLTSVFPWSLTLFVFSAGFAGSACATFSNHKQGCVLNINKLSWPDSWAWIKPGLGLNYSTKGESLLELFWVQAQAWSESGKLA